MKFKPDKDIFVCKVEKSPRQVVHFLLRTYRNRDFIDIRTYFREDGREAPTGKGVSVPPHLWREFRAAVAQVDAALIDHGWLDREDLGGEG